VRKREVVNTKKNMKKKELPLSTAAGGGKIIVKLLPDNKMTQ
jgi:hypothetical protein